MPPRRTSACKKLNDNLDTIDAQIQALKEEAARASWVGEIRMHSGDVASIALIPGGVWKLCDGQHGTPNLVGRFIAAAGDVDGVRPHQTGGAASWTGKVAWRVMAGLRAVGHALTLGQMPAHQHGGRTNDEGEHDHDVGFPRGGNNFGNQAGGLGNPIGPEGGRTGIAGRHGHNFATDWRGNNEAHDHGLPDLSHDHEVTVPTTPLYYALCFVKRVA
jgi:hypothetical protein